MHFWKSLAGCKCIFLLAAISAPSLSAVDVVYLKNGDVVIGTLIGPVDRGISYQSFGAEVTIPLELITLTEKSLESLSTKNLNVVMKDGSTITGKIVDYDEDIGVFLDISFGTLTIPGNAVSRIFDMVKRKRYTGSDFQFTVFGGTYWPLATSAEFFSMNWYAGTGASIALPFVRGLYTGAKATVFGMGYIPDSSVNYLMVSLCPEITYKYLGWRMNDNFLSRIIPYGTLGAGPVYIAVNDPSSYPSSFGTITADITLSAGLEFVVYAGVVAKLEGTGSVIFQKGAPFINAGALLSLGYEQ